MLLPRSSFEFLDSLGALQEWGLKGDFALDRGSLAQLALSTGLRVLRMPETIVPSLAFLRALEVLQLELLSLELPEQCQSVAQLPPGLRAAYLKGMRLESEVGWAKTEDLLCIDW